MDSSFEDVRALLVTLCEKLGNVDEIDAFSVANIIFGFQVCKCGYSNCYFCNYLIIIFFEVSAYKYSMFDSLCLS